MSQVYNSVYTGNQIDSALGVIVNSGVSAANLTVLVGVTPGIAVANKAVVLDSNKNFAGIVNMSVDVLSSGYLNLPDLVTDPVATPAAGRKFLYIKGGNVWIKSSNGTTKQLKSGQEKEVVFTSQTTVVVNHLFNHKFPMVDISVSDVKAIARVEYTDVNNTTIRFNSPQSGRVICRIV